MPDWPATIPFEPVVGTYFETPRENAVRTNFAAGPAQTRRRFTAVPLDVGFTLQPISRDQYAVLQDWFANDIASGALSFTATNPMTGAPGSYRFMRPYRAAPDGIYVSVEIELELLP